MKAVLKSLGLGALGMALFFCFFTLIAIPISMLVARAHGPAAPDAFLPVPPWVFRRVGLPLSVGAFAAGFVMGMRKFGSNRHSALRIQSSSAREQR